jgi:hypothetical protein
MRALRLRLARRVTVAVTCAAIALGTLAAPALGAGVTFGTPSATSKFNTGIVFTQPVSGGSFAEADIVLMMPGDIGPTVVKLKNPGSSTLTYTLDTSTGGLEPNTKVVARFQVVFDDGTTQQGPEIKITYTDDRYSWKTLAGTLVTLHWYSGDATFAQKALAMGENGISKSAKFLGVTETTPIDFFVYATQQPFYDALGPGTRENVGGLANTVTRTLFALIAPTDLGYASTVVPHELTHVVFDDGTDNPYHSPPRWLNEGIAVYLSQGFDSDDRRLVSDAAKSKTLMPLSALTGQFPTTANRFYLAYAESVSAVSYMVGKYGQPAFQKLMIAYRGGASDDEAFTTAFGVDTAAINKAWLATNGITAPPSYGPQPAPTGPLPPGWTSNGGGSTQSGGPSGSAAPGASGATSPGSDGSGGSGDSSTVLILAAGIAGLGLCLLAAAIVLSVRGRDAATPL